MFHSEQVTNRRPPAVRTTAPNLACCLLCSAFAHSCGARDARSIAAVTARAAASGSGTYSSAFAARAARSKARRRRSRARVVPIVRGRQQHERGAYDGPALLAGAVDQPLIQRFDVLRMRFLDSFLKGSKARLYKEIVAVSQHHGRQMMLTVVRVLYAPDRHARAPHPPQTEDTGTQGTGNVEIENGFSSTRAQGWGDTNLDFKWQVALLRRRARRARDTKQQQGHASRAMRLQS